MSIQGTDLYNFASDLYRSLDPKNPEESIIRTIISRAYYGAFLNARDQANISNTGFNVHVEVQNHYMNKGQLGNRISNRLRDLISKRHTADYRNSDDLNPRDAQLALKLSGSILDDLNPAP